MQTETNAVQADGHLQDYGLLTRHSRRTSRFWMSRKFGDVVAREIKEY